MATTTSAAFRARWRQLSGFALHDPKHAHGGCCPLDSRSASNALNASSNTVAIKAGSGFTNWAQSSAPTMISVHGTNGMTAAGAPSARAWAGHDGPAEILAPPAARKATPTMIDAINESVLTRGR